MSNPDEELPTPQQVQKLAMQVAEVLRGKDPTLQGATLLEVTSIFFAGHHPDIRDGVIDFWVENLRPMVAVNAKLYHEPGDWDLPPRAN